MNHANLDVNAQYYEDLDAEREHERYARARADLNLSDVLAEVDSLVLEITDDAQHPLYGLVAHCVQYGTTHETGRRPHMAAQVGDAFLPLIERAIGRLVQAQLCQDQDDGTRDGRTLV
jgi:hypothetical protein